MSSGIAHGRLTAERKAWRKDHPHGFVAKPETDADGLVNMMVWRCTIPGKPNFPPGFFHPNVYPSGTVCLSILDESQGWRASFTVKQILVAIQNLLENPSPDKAAQSQSNQILSEQPNEYRRRVREQASRYPPPV